MERGIRNITCILDACSIINLIHIDTDDYIIKKLKYVDWSLCEKVFQEVKNNVYNKLNLLRKKNKIKKEDLVQLKENIDYSLNKFRNNQIFNHEIEYELGNDFFDELKKLTGYNKQNGEFYSTALALYLSRCKPTDEKKIDFYSTKVFFHTDDSPAKYEFSQFYLQQQIGYIEDTADLLVLLYRLDPDFSSRKLDDALSNLFQEYASEVTVLKTKLLDIKNNFSVASRKDKLLVINLNNLIQKLDKLDFKGVNVIKDYFMNDFKKYKNIVNIINLHLTVFDLESKTTNLLKKIKDLRSYLPNIHVI